MIFPHPNKVISRLRSRKWYSDTQWSYYQVRALTSRPPTSAFIEPRGSVRLGSWNLPLSSPVYFKCPRFSPVYWDPKYVEVTNLAKEPKL